MARYDDTSMDVTRWTNRKLMAELRLKANLSTFQRLMVGSGENTALTADAIRNVTRPYRDSYLNPVIDEIERRFVRTK